MFTDSIPLTQQQRAIDWRDQFDTFFGADRSVSLPQHRDDGSEPLSPDYLPEMADCRGW